MEPLVLQNRDEERESSTLGRCLCFSFIHNLLVLFLSGFLLFKDFCFNEIDEAVPQLKFYEEVSPARWD